MTVSAPKRSKKSTRHTSIKAGPSRRPKGSKSAAELVEAGHQIVKTTDEKGRVVLSKKFANRTVIVEEVSETEVLIKLARVIPEREAWLFKNPEALASVQRGLAQARARQFVPGPDLEADAKWLKQLEHLED